MELSILSKKVQDALNLISTDYRPLKKVALCASVSALALAVSGQSLAAKLDESISRYVEYDEDVTITVKGEPALDATDRDAGLTLNGHDLIIDASEKTHGLLAEDKNLTITDAHDITIDVVGTTSREDGDGINAKGDANVTLSASGLFHLTAKSNQADGIYVEGSGQIRLDANEVTIEATNNGIDFRGSENGSMTLGSGNSIPSRVKIITTSGDGIRVSAEDDATLTVKTEELEITSGDVGLNANAGLLTVNSGSNFIKGENALRGSGGCLVVSAEGSVDNANNVLIGKENGLLIDAGDDLNHRIYAENTNTIAGGQNGINISAKNSDTTITAKNANVIGKYVPVEGEVLLSETGINVTGGTLTLNADLNEIYASRTGISASSFDQDSVVTIEGSSSVIEVQGGLSDNNDYLYGIKASWDADVSSNHSGNMSIILSDMHGGVRGIYADKGASVTLKQHGFNLLVTQANTQGGGNPQAQDKKSFGIAVNTDTLNLTPPNDVNSDSSTSLIRVDSTDDLRIGVNSLEGADFVSGVYNDYEGNVTLEAGSDIFVEATGNNLAKSGVVAAIHNGQARGGLVTTSSKGGDIVLNAYIKETNERNTIYGVNSKSGSTALVTESRTDIEAESGGVSISAIGNEFSSSTGVSGVGSSKRQNIVKIKATENITISAMGGSTVKGISASSSAENFVESKGDVLISAIGLEKVLSSGSAYIYGVDSFNGNNEIKAIGNVVIGAYNYGSSATSYGLHTLSNSSNASTTLIEGNSITLLSTSDNSYGIFSETASNPKQTKVTLTTENGVGEQLRDIVITAYDGGISASNNVKSLTENMSIELLSADSNRIFVYDESGYGISSKNAIVSLSANEGSNEIWAGFSVETVLVDGQSEEYYVGKGRAIDACDGAAVTLLGETNTLYGAVVAGRSNTTEKSSHISIVGSNNFVSSYSFIQNAGGLENDNSVISAIYAEGSATSITFEGRNYLNTYAEYDNPNQRERVIWAYDGADVTVNGFSVITTNSYDKSPNSLDMAIAAGTAKGLDETDFGDNYPTGDEKISKVEIKYENDYQNGNRSFISGDILSAYAGEVIIKALDPEDTQSGIDVNGNLLAGNGGTLTIDLGKGGSFTGRADDYVDAGTKLNGNTHATFFNPAFSSTIYQGGTVTLEMGEGSTWNVTGQSWLTNLTGNGGTIVLTNNNESAGEGEDLASHAVHIQHLEGQHTFVVKLNDKDHLESDMIYVNEVNPGSERQVIKIASFEGYDNMQHNDRIRFATVNTSDKVLTFITEEDLENSAETGSSRMSRTQLRDEGFYDMGFRIESEARIDDEAENDYDGEKFTDKKPGENYVEEYYGSNSEAQNWYLVRDKSGDSTSDGGETILATARAAYWNAVEIDRLNKRLGDARHADGGTDGFWVRVRNDRIGTDAGVGDFRSRNYAYQFGYDHTEKEDDGKRLFGAALDYMDGNTTYRDVEGTGATDRFGVTAYMTWLGDDGWYYDLVGKWGVLSNSFRITSDYGVFVDGDYDNHVLGASFEFGRKLTKENSPWFLEPQAQIQHVMVTEASYSTNQGTHVDLDKINSTITRLGFRIGRNFGEKQSGVVYAKADWLKEWHGHQGIRVTDGTTGNMAADASLDNKGNWFDVGFGVQSPITDTTYFFVDAEYVFGNDLDNTWNFNAGLRWMFH